MTSLRTKLCRLNLKKTIGKETTEPKTKISGTLERGHVEDVQGSISERNGNMSMAHKS
jgi:hypothetical protein